MATKHLVVAAVIGLIVAYALLGRTEHMEMTTLTTKKPAAQQADSQMITVDVPTLVIIVVGMVAAIGAGVGILLWIFSKLKSALSPSAPSYGYPSYYGRPYGARR